MDQESMAHTCTSHRKNNGTNIRCTHMYMHMHVGPHACCLVRCHVPLNATLGIRWLLEAGKGRRGARGANGTRVVAESECSGRRGAGTSWHNDGVHYGASFAHSPCRAIATTRMARGP